MTSAVPTLQDYQSYGGGHTHLLWKAAGPDWICPSCSRTKFEILRWTKRFPKSENPFYGWMAPLHQHHDHSGHRFPTALICDQCNAVDGQAKRRLNLPKNFSFSPSEIAKFICSTPHSPHKIDLIKAMAIYRDIALENPDLGYSL